MIFSNDTRAGVNLERILKDYPKKERAKCAKIYKKFRICMLESFKINDLSALDVFLKAVYDYHAAWIDHSINDDLIKTHLKSVLKADKKKRIKWVQKCKD